MRALYTASSPQNGRILSISTTKNYMIEEHIREGPVDKNIVHENMEASIHCESDCKNISIALEMTKIVKPMELSHMCLQ